MDFHGNNAEKRLLLNFISELCNIRTPLENQADKAL